uniref:Uncharacterized protein n=1 Tax=Arundo donax TaxID=35708 RepID=A0A0A9H8G7_ARUDO
MQQITTGDHHNRPFLFTCYQCLTFI